MFRFLRGSAPAEKPAPSMPAGLTAYAIGDVHGRLDLLTVLYEMIAADVALAPSERVELVFLGDYIDRGPASAGVVDLILDVTGRSRFATRALKGNHEAALLAFLQDPRKGPAWLSYGAAATLESYGVRAPSPGASAEDWSAARDALSRALPEGHLRFYEALELYVVHGDYCFVHAGLKPKRALADQAEDDLLSIRAEFLNSKAEFEKMIVHGHTPSVAPEFARHRIGIDTGAFATGTLTCLKLSGRETAILQARL